MAALVSLEIADPPEVWEQLGFEVDAGICAVSGVAHVLGVAGDGVMAWAVDGAAGGELDGLPDGAAAPVFADGQHPNGVVALDHLVVSTPDLGRTIEAFEKAGLDLRRTREAGKIHQAFFKLDGVVLEVVGPPYPASDGPARFFGLAWTVRDLDATAAYLGDRLRPAKDAVQPGRMIATLDKGAGSTVAMAFMSDGRPSD